MVRKNSARNAINVGKASWCRWRNANWIYSLPVQIWMGCIMSFPKHEEMYGNVGNFSTSSTDTSPLVKSKLLVESRSECPCSLGRVTKTRFPQSTINNILVSSTPCSRFLLHFWNNHVCIVLVTVLVLFCWRCLLALLLAVLVLMVVVLAGSAGACAADVAIVLQVLLLLVLLMM